MVDLDSSVFMNFKRYTKVDVANCFEADMRSSDFESVIKQEEEVSDSFARAWDRRHTKTIIEHLGSLYYLYINSLK